MGWEDKAAYEQFTVSATDDDTDRERRTVTACPGLDRGRPNRTSSARA
jgi:hypothetical protein